MSTMRYRYSAFARLATFRVMPRIALSIMLCLGAATAPGQDSVEVQVTARVRPTITGLDLKAGDKVRIAATGTWCWGEEPSCSDANGTPDTADQSRCNLTLPGAPRGALIGLIDNGREIFQIGSARTYTVPEGTSGELMLLMNDCMGMYGDNSGHLDVTVERIIEAPTPTGSPNITPALAQILGGRPANRNWIERAQPPELARALPRYLGEVEREAARKYFEEAAATGHPVAEAWLGRWLALEKDTASKERGDQLLRRNIVALREHAKKGDGNAMFLLGWVYSKGSAGVEKSEEEAARWWEAGAEQDHPLCMGDLAIPLFNTGDETPDDFPKAVSLFTRAAELGITTAIYNLGVAYEHGKGVTADNRIAFLMMEAAANRGQTNAMAALGRYYRDGIGTPKDPFARLYWEARHGWAKADSDGTMAGPFLRLQGDGQIGKVNALAYSPDGSRLYAAGEDKVVYAWDAAAGQLKGIYRLPVGESAAGGIETLDCSPCGRFLAVGADGAFTLRGLVYILDAESGSILDAGAGHEAMVRSVRFSPGGRRLVTTAGTSTGGHTAVVWSVSEEGRLRGESILEGHEGSVWNVAWIREKPGRLVTASFDKTLRIWTEQADGSWASQVLTGHTGQVLGVDVSPDGTTIVSASGDGTLRAWDASTGEFVRTLLDLSTQSLAGVAYSPGGDVLAVSQSQKMMRLTTDGKVLLEYNTNQRCFRPAWNPRIPDFLSSNVGMYSNDIYTVSTTRNEQILTGRSPFVYSVASRADSILWGYTFDIRSLNERGPLEYEFNPASLEVVPVEDPAEAQRAVTANDEWWISMPSRTEIRFMKGDSTISTYTCTSGLSFNAVTLLGSNLAATTGYFRLSIVNPSDGKLVRELFGHEGDATTLAPMDGGRLLLSGATDCTWRLWNPESGELLLSFYMDRNSEWVVWTPQGYYACSAAGDRLLGWAVNRGFAQAPEFYDASRFRSQFERPDVIALIPQLGDVGLAVAEANKARQDHATVSALDIREDLETLLPPQISFVMPVPKQVVREEMIDVVLRLDPGKSAREIKDVVLLVNGRPQRAVGRVSHETLDEEGAGERIITRRVQLLPGPNTLTAMATNDVALSNLVSIDIEYEASAGTELVPACLYALCIGVGDYVDDSYDLPAAGSDARRIAEALQSHAGRLFSRVETRVVVDSEATGGDILDALEWLERSATQHDVAVLYVGGHGVQDEMEHYYFLPHDYDPERLRRTGVRWTEFERTVEAIPGRLLFFLDTCQAGGVTGAGVQTRKFRGPNAVRNALRDLARDEVGAVVMSATTSEGAAQESDEWGGGAFTTALVEGLAGSADHAASPDGIITIKELDLFVTMRVKELTEGTQRPTTLFPITITDFPIARAE